MNSSESAEELVKIMLEGTEVLARISGTGIERIAVALYTISKDKKMTKGKVNLNNMLKSGGNLQVFSLKEEHLKKFNEESKKYGVVYTALINKKRPDKDGMVDIMVRAEDAPRINRIVERFNLSAFDKASIKSEIEKDKIEEMIKDAKERGVPVKSDEEKLADDIMTKPIQKEENEISNPKVAKTEKSPLSELSLENKKKEGVVSKEKKPSVRKQLNEIKEELKNKETEKQEIKDKPKKVINQQKTKDKKKFRKGKER